MLKLLTNASPAVTAVSPVSILKVVVFPAPFTPSRPKHSARPTPKVSRLTATRSYFFTRFRTYIYNLYNLLCTSPFLPPSPPLSQCHFAICLLQENVLLSQELLFKKNGNCSCGDKLHGAPGWETGQLCRILAVPLGTALYIP
jgi:hypothetical protein